MSQPRPPAPPPTIEGFTFVKLLGSGGFSDVFLYEREFPRQKVAVKVLVPDAVDEETSRRFTAEANVMASLSNHPYIVSVYEARVTDDGRPYLVMQHYPRPNFHVRARAERFTVPAVLRAGIQVAAAVETAHRAGVLHRDIKPSNILTSEYGRPGLTDFGIAVAGDAAPAEAEGMSIPWSPPEIVAGSGQGDVRSDVYSLGATLWTLLAGGRSPFEAVGGDNRNIDLIDRIERGNVAPVDRPDVPDSLQRLLAQAMSKEPRGRPSSAAELARSLQVIEVEQRFDMTPFEVSDDGAAGAGSGEQIDVDAGATRVKDLGVIESQAERRRRPRARARDRGFDPDAGMITSAPVSRDESAASVPDAPAPEIISSSSLRTAGPVPPPAAPPGSGGPAPGQGGAPVVGADDRVAAAYAAPRVTPDDTASERGGDGGEPPARRGRRTPIVVAGVVLALVLVAGLVLLLVRDDGDGDTTAPSTTEAFDERPPPVEQVRVEELGEERFVVSWTLPDDLVGTDEIRIEGLSEDPEILSSRSTRWEFRSPSSRHCPTVTVVREGRASEPASPGGCG